MGKFPSIFVLTYFCEFCFAFRTCNANATFSFRNTNFLLACRTLVYMMRFPLVHHGFFRAKLGYNPVFNIQVFDIFLIALLDISREHTVVHIEQ